MPMMDDLATDITDTPICVEINEELLMLFKKLQKFNWIECTDCQTHLKLLDNHINQIHLTLHVEAPKPPIPRKILKLKADRALRKKIQSMAETTPSGRSTFEYKTGNFELVALEIETLDSPENKLVQQEQPSTSKIAQTIPLPKTTVPANTVKLKPQGPLPVENKSSRPIHNIVTIKTPLLEVLKNLERLKALAKCSTDGPSSSKLISLTVEPRDKHLKQIINAKNQTKL